MSDNSGKHAAGRHRYVLEDRGHEVLDANAVRLKMLGWTAASTAIKMGGGLLVNKQMAADFGPRGFGQAGGMMALIDQLDSLSGAGTVNGINKYVAEFRDHPRVLRRLLGTASTITLVYATLLALLLLLAEVPVSRWLLGEVACQGLIKAVAAVQFAISGANLLRALLKGRSDAVGNSLASIGGALLGVGAYYLTTRYYGYCGALLGLALVPAWTLVTAGIIFHLRNHLSWRWLKPLWHAGMACKLFRFSAMTAVKSVAYSAAFAILRQLMMRHYSWDDMGMWQGMQKISYHYYQITTAFLSVYLLPLIAYLRDKTEVFHAVFSTLCFILPLALGVSLATWILRDHLIRWMFTQEFSPMRDLLAWQLTGDVLRIGGAVITSLLLGKALLWLHLLSEVTALVLMVLFSHLLVPHYGAVGGAQAYLATHLIHFSASLTVLGYCQRRFQRA